MLQRAYPELFALVGSHVPDFRGLFLRGFGQQAHTQINGSTVGQTTTVHKSGALGTVQGDAIRNITGEIGGAVEENSGVASGAFTYPKISGGGDGGHGDYAVNFDASRVVPTAEEIRPVNVAVRYLIRARS